MKIKVNKDKCLGCGMCVGICPDVYDFDDDGLATSNNDNINDENIEEVKEAINSCPVGAIEKENYEEKEN